MSKMLYIDTKHNISIVIDEEFINSLTYVGKSPFIGSNGNWFQWNDNAGRYIDTGVRVNWGKEEQQRKFAETARQTAEDNRKIQEQARGQNEDQRVQNEDQRQQAEQQRDADERSRQEAEEARSSAYARILGVDLIVDVVNGELLLYSEALDSPIDINMDGNILEVYQS